MSAGVQLKDYILGDQWQLIYQFYRGGLCSLSDIDFAILEALVDSPMFDEPNVLSGGYEIIGGSICIYGYYCNDSCFYQGIRSESYIKLRSWSRYYKIGQEILKRDISLALWIFRTLKIIGEIT